MKLDLIAFGQEFGAPALFAFVQGLFLLWFSRNHLREMQAMRALLTAQQKVYAEDSRRSDEVMTRIIDSYTSMQRRMDDLGRVLEIISEQNRQILPRLQIMSVDARKGAPQNG